MKAKKAYTSPEIKSEVVEIGVYGCYGSSDKDLGGIFANPASVITTFFGIWCCQ